MIAEVVVATAHPFSFSKPVAVENSIVLKNPRGPLLHVASTVRRPARARTPAQQHLDPFRARSRSKTDNNMYAATRPQPGRSRRGHAAARPWDRIQRLAAAAAVGPSLLFLAVAASAAPAAAKVAEYHWTVTESLQALDGVPRLALGLNGRPGHETSIVVDSGDTIVVHVTNNLTVPTSLHWHGLHQYGTNEMDGGAGATQCPIAPGDTFTHRFSTEGQYGTFWWHAHHGTQYADGLRGPIIIRDPPAIAAILPPYDTDSVMDLTDWYHTPTDELTRTFYLNGTVNPDGKEPMFDSGLINGRGVYNCSLILEGRECAQQSPPVFVFESRKTHRIRVLSSASFAGFRFSIDDHRLTIIEVDGVTVEPYTVDTIELNTGQRYSVLVTTNRTSGNYWIRAEMYHGPPWTTLDPSPGFISTAFGVFQYSGSPSPTTPPTSQPDPNGVFLRDTDLSPIPAGPAPRLTADSLDLIFAFNFETRPADKYQKGYVYLSVRGDEDAALRVGNATSPARLGPHPALPNIDPAGSSFAISDGQSILRSLAHPPRTPLAALPRTANIASLEPGQVMQMTIVNRDAGEHPFHMHGHAFWVVARGIARRVEDIPPVDEESVSGAGANPLRRDVVTVDACPTEADEQCEVDPETGEVSFGYSIVRVLADNPGVWLFHCHIEWHIAAGLVMVFVESASEVIDRGVSMDNVRLCHRYNAWKDLRAHGGQLDATPPLPEANPAGERPDALLLPPPSAAASQQRRATLGALWLLAAGVAVLLMRSRRAGFSRAGTAATTTTTAAKTEKSAGGKLWSGYAPAPTAAATEEEELGVVGLADEDGALRSA
ncbi:Cupredoxin [Zopfochytrium polystomum]|nr:Cupredoxin [Zopfochytrium polystomum]